MKPIAIVGALLVVFGIVALAYQGLTYTILSGGAVAAGVVLLIVGSRKK